MPITASATMSQIHHGLELLDFAGAATVVEVVVDGAVVEVVVAGDVVVVTAFVDVVVAAAVVGGLVGGVVGGGVVGGGVVGGGVVGGGTVGVFGRVVGVVAVVGGVVVDEPTMFSARVVVVRGGRVVVVRGGRVVVVLMLVLGSETVGALTVGRVPPPGREPPELPHAATVTPSATHTSRRALPRLTREQRFHSGRARRASAARACRLRR
jgi:hypothetical protein